MRDEYKKHFHNIIDLASGAALEKFIHVKTALDELDKAAARGDGAAIQILNIMVDID